MRGWAGKILSGGRDRLPLLMAIAVGSVIAISGSGCTNFGEALMGRRGSSVRSEDPLSNLTGTGSGLLTLSRVVVSKNDVNSFDLIGDGSGTLDTYCTSTNGGSESEIGPSNCTCSYSYITSAGSSERFDAPTSYRESNLIRCSRAGIPATVPYVKVSIHLTNADSFSNEVTFRFDGGNGAALDLSNPLSFSYVRRYQCKDSVFIPYLWDSNIYDPIRSEDPEISYPLNFYTTNMGGAIASFVSNELAKPSGGTGWNCPATPNDTAEGMDLTVFSVQSDGSSKKIFPAAGSVFDRSTFYLARQPSGVFGMPVNSFIAPNTITTANGGTDSPPPLGYGAAPVPSGNGTEVCPETATTIPSGFRWVKVWLFRGSLADRKTRTSAALAQAGTIACNPGRFPISNNSVFIDCDPAAVANSTGTAIADRVIQGGNNFCVRLGSAPGFCADKDQTGIGCTTWASGVPATQIGTQKDFGETNGTVTHNGPNYSSFSVATDVWRPRAADAQTTCGSGSLQDPLNLCSAFGNYDGAYGGAVAHDPNPGVASIDGGVSRFDYLFVVSPPTVMTKDFKEGTAASLPYTPYRFYSPTFCQSPDPDNPLTPGDCQPAHIINYGFKFHDVTTNGDAPANDSGRLPVFPVCALQPI